MSLMVGPIAEGERAGGVENLRRGFLLLLGASMISLVVELPVMPARARPLEAGVAAFVMWGLMAGFLVIVLLILAVLSWVFRIVGWGKLCRGWDRKFYCYVRTILVLLPVLGIVIVIAAIVMVVAEILTLGPAMGVLVLERAKGLVIYLLLGVVLVAASFVIEGVALLDFSYVLKSMLLRGGGALYIAAYVLSVLDSVVGTLRPASVVKTAFSISSSILAVASAFVLYWAFRVVEKVERGEEGA